MEISQTDITQMMMFNMVGVDVSLNMLIRTTQRGTVICFMSGLEAVGFHFSGVAMCPWF